MVIAIIGILSSIVLVSLGSAKASARDAKRVSDVKNIQIALALYYNDNLKYPTQIYATYPTGLVFNGSGAGYMTVVPTDPSGSNYVYQAFDATAGAGICSSASYPPVRYDLGRYA